MQFKNEVDLKGLQLPMRKVLLEAGKLWDVYGHELVITECRGGEHSPGSLHYYGYALDLRTRYFSKTDQLKIRAKLQTLLGNDYDVIFHTSHIHVEYDKIIK